MPDEPQTTHQQPPRPDLFTWEFATDPYPAYAWLREHSPVHRTTLPSGVDAWLVTRYADARQALADGRLSKNPSHHSGQAHRTGRVGDLAELIHRKRADLGDDLISGLIRAGERSALARSPSEG